VASNRSRKPSPDHLLAPEQFPELNRAFYATRPWEYFRHRERLLALTAGAPEKLLAAGRDGVQVGRLHFQLQGDPQQEEQDAEDRERFLLADSQILLHHVSETLLRLYLAHENLPPCPWLEVARVRGPGAFKKLVQGRFVEGPPQDESRRRVAGVFLGTSNPKGLTPHPPIEAWNEGLDNIEAFLRHYARHFLDADVYNALKHGLVVRPGDSHTQLDDGELIKAEGPALEYLSQRKDVSGRLRWNRSTRWLEFDRSLVFVFMATRLMESLWSIARARYLEDEPPPINLWTEPAYGQVADRLEEGQNSAILVDTMHMELAYYLDPDHGGDAAELAQATRGSP
jgi:hypothetical protein